VTVDALPRRHDVSARQLKASSRMVKRGVSPEYRVVAGLARRREPNRNVIHRRGCIVVIGLVAGHTSRSRQVVVVIDMAIGTLPGWNHVRTGQRKTGAAVVERRVEPGRRVVTGVARLGKVRGRVIRVRRSLEVLEVARNARGGRQVVVVVDMAIDALPRRHRVHAR